MDSIHSFGEWLRQRREALRLTRPELAECVGCSVSALRKIEADERRPSRQLAELLAGCLGIGPEEQPRFLDAARGVRPVARLGRPAPDVIPEPLPPRPFPSAASSSDRAGQPDWNFPAPATPLLGREAELATLVQLLDDPECRLLTLFGPGGIGKTRLAIEVAYLQWEYFTDGVFFASLAATSSPDLMVPAVAQAVGLNFAGSADPRHQLVSYLSNRQLLLLLDNLEHLLDGVDLLVETLEAAPGVTLLVTSRERLELQAEWVFEVQGLPVPAEGEVEGLEKYSSVRLFLQRARHARLDFELSVENCPHVMRICRLVEGMPLAIELAAAWVPILSCAEIADEIECGLDILTTQLRDVPERQRSVDAVIEHSWKLLEKEERRALRHLSVFRGGFQREAAQAVDGASLPLLSALIAKSFLRRSSTGRFTMHELVRQYIASRLANGPEEEVAARDRHSAYYTDFAAQVEGELKGARQVEALAEMHADIDNIRSAWRWTVRRGHVAVARKPLRALWCFYDMRSLYQEVEAIFAWAAEEVDTALRLGDDADGGARTLREYLRAWLGWFYLRRGKLEQGELLLQSSLSSLRSFDISVELADVLYFTAAAAFQSGDYPRARAHWREELAIAEQYGNQWDIGLATIGVALIAQTVGEYEEAEERWQTALAIERRLGDRRMLAAALYFSGILKRALGAYGEAQARFRESLELSTIVGERLFYGMALSELGLVTGHLGDHVEAIRLLKESITLLRELGEHWSLLQALNGLGAATLAIGAYAESHAAYGEALTLARERQNWPDVLEALTGLSRWWLEQGSPEVGLESALFALDHPSATEQTRESARQLKEELEVQLGSAKAMAVQVRTESLSFEALVESVLAPVPEP